MIIKSYINTNNISQYYCFDENNPSIEYFNYLDEYKDLTKNTIFICSSQFDINLINFHKGKKWIFFYY